MYHSWSGTTIFLLGGPSTTLHPRSARNTFPSVMAWQRAYSKKCWSSLFVFSYQHITNASKSSNLFYSLKSKGKKQLQPLPHHCICFSVKIWTIVVCIHHQAISHSLLIWPIQCHMNASLEAEQWPVSVCPNILFSPSLSLSAELETVVLKLSSGSLSSLNPLNTQVSCRLFPLSASFLSDLICSYGFSFHRYAAYSHICVSISALFSEFQAHSSSYMLNISISQTIMYLLQIRCYDRYSGTICPQESHLFNRVWGHTGLKSHASPSRYATSLLLLLESVFGFRSPQGIFMFFLPLNPHISLSLNPVTSTSVMFPSFLLSTTVIAHDLTTSHLGHCHSAPPDSLPTIRSLHSWPSSTSKRRVWSCHPLIPLDFCPLENTRVTQGARYQFRLHGSTPSVPDE